MTPPPIFRSGHGFTMVEIALSLAIVSSAILALLALMPLASEAADDAANSTITGIVLEDVHRQLVGKRLVESPGSTYGTFFYDDQGLFLTNATSSTTPTFPTGISPRYRAEVRLITPSPQPKDTTAGNVLAAKISLFWPVHPSTGEALGVGSAAGGLKSKKELTYLVTSLNGQSWNSVGNRGGSTFNPKIEF